MEGIGDEEISGTLYYVYADTSDPIDPVRLDLGSSEIVLRRGGED
jgi:hypothetical protein